MQTSVKSEYEGIYVTEEMLLKFDAMLTEYGIDHAFRYPTESEFNETENVEEIVMYFEEDHAAYDLVYLLWVHKVVGISDKKIVKAAAKAFAKLIG